jgi:hypothetical protein
MVIIPVVLVTGGILALVYWLDKRKTLAQMKQQPA